MIGFPDRNRQGTAGSRGFLEPGFRADGAKGLGGGAAVMEARNPPAPPMGAIVAICISNSVVQMQVSIVNLAIPAINASFGASVSELQWVIAAYTLSFAVLLLAAGALGDRIGTKMTFLAGFLVVALACLGCGFSSSIGLLNFFRSVQGAGAALLVPSSLALARKVYGHDKRLLARTIAIWAAIGGASFAAGPIVGGILLSAWGWPSIFLVNIPLCMLGFLISARFVHVKAGEIGGAHFDGTSQILFMASVFSFVGAAIEFRPLGYLHPLVWGGVIGGGGLAVSFALIQRTAKAPVLPGNLLREPYFTTPILCGFIINMTYGGMIFLISLYLQVSLSYSAAQAGYAFIPLTATFVAANLVGGRLSTNFGPRFPIILGTLAAAIGYALLIRCGAGTGFFDMLPGFIFIPLGMGMTIPAMTTAVLEIVDQARSGTASAVFNTSRQVGSAAGVAIFGTLAATGTAAEIIEALRISSAVSSLLLVFSILISFRMKRRE